MIASLSISSPSEVEGVEVNYISPPEMRSYLETHNILLSLEEVTELQQLVISKIESWLNYRPVLSQYVEKARASEVGIIRLRYYPVQKIVRVRTLQGSSNPWDESWAEGSAQWWGSHYLYGAYPYTLTEITYQAGYNPIPDRFILALKNVMLAVYKNYNGDAAQLDNPVSDVKSIKLPGGVSQTFVTGERDSSSRNSANNVSNLERILNGLQRDRNNLIF